jgi:NTE family protein
MIPPPEKNNIRTMMERTFNLMSNSNTIFDKTYCDILIEVKGIEKYHMFDLNNMDAISEIGFHHAAMKMSEKESWKIVEKCHKHFERTKQIQKNIESIRKKIYY